MKRDKILRFLSEACRTSEEIAVFMLGGASYSFSRGGISGGLKAVEQLRRSRWRHSYADEHARSEARKIRKVVEMLRYDKLIRSEKKDGKTFYSVSSKGARWLHSYALAQKDVPPKKAYSKQESNHINIVVYDIPHSRRRYRDWFRNVLLELGFLSLQRSVFVGKQSLPRELLDDLGRAQLLSCIHVCQVTKQGTLRSTS